MSKRLKLAIAAQAAAERAVEKTLREDYPLGAVVYWENGHSNGAAGTVVLHGYGDRIKVRNEKTGKEYWVLAHRIAALV